MKWLRLWVDTLHNPKTALLPAETFRGWIFALMVAAELESEGVLPPIEEFCFRARMTATAAEKLFAALEAAKLLETDDAGNRRLYRWAKYQRRSDNAARRMRQTRTQAATKAAGPELTEATAEPIGANSPADVARVLNFAATNWPTRRAFRVRAEEWLVTHPAERILAAMEAAAQAEAISPKYVDRILDAPPPARDPPPRRRRKRDPDPDAAATRNAELSARLKREAPEW